MKLSKVIFAVALAAAMTACKPSEESYRRAYESAKNRDTDPIEETIYNKIRQRARPQQIVAGTDTLDYKVEPVTLTDSDTPLTARAKRYNVVVGQFKQIFNARAMSERLASLGYDPFIINTAEPLYYVVASTCDTAAEALAALAAVKADSRFASAPPCPIVVSPTAYSR